LFSPAFYRGRQKVFELRDFGVNQDEADLLETGLETGRQLSSSCARTPSIQAQKLPILRLFSDIIVDSASQLQCPEDFAGRRSVRD
jgi:hypothetical protein